MDGRVLSRDEFVSRMSARLGLSSAPKTSVKAHGATSPNKSAGTPYGTDMDWLNKPKKSKRKAPRMSKPELPVANRTGSNRGMYKARPLRRDDGVVYATISAALLEAGYSPGGATKARDRIDAGKVWKDGHRYEFI